MQIKNTKFILGTLMAISNSSYAMPPKLSKRAQERLEQIKQEQIEEESNEKIALEKAKDVFAQILIDNSRFITQENINPSMLSAGLKQQAFNLAGQICYVLRVIREKKAKSAEENDAIKKTLECIVILQKKLHFVDQIPNINNARLWQRISHADLQNEFLLNVGKLTSNSFPLMHKDIVDVADAQTKNDPGITGKVIIQYAAANLDFMLKYPDHGMKTQIQLDGFCIFHGSNFEEIAEDINNREQNGYCKKSPFFHPFKNINKFVKNLVLDFYFLFFGVNKKVINTTKTILEILVTAIDNGRKEEINSCCENLKKILPLNSQQFFLIDPSEIPIISQKNEEKIQQQQSEEETKNEMPYQQQNQQQTEESENDKPDQCPKYYIEMTTLDLQIQELENQMLDPAYANQQKKLLDEFAELCQQRKAERQQQLQQQGDGNLNDIAGALKEMTGYCFNKKPASIMAFFQNKSSPWFQTIIDMLTSFNPKDPNLSIYPVKGKDNIIGIDMSRQHGNPNNPRLYINPDTKEVLALGHIVSGKQQKNKPVDELFIHYGSEMF